ncbi:MAG: TRAP transporter small permease [Pseudomonadota bacterium]
MAGASSVLTDGSLLSRLDRGLYRVERVLALIGGLAVFSLMLLAVVSVAGRNFMGRPLPGYVDWIEQAMPIIAFLAVAYCQRDGGHIRMDILVGQLRGRMLWIVEFLMVALMLVLMLLLVWGTWSHFGRSFDWNAPMWSRDSSFDIRLPIWPAKLVVPVAFAVISARLALQLVAYGRAIVSGSLTPVAVPLIEDAATVAAHEAATVSGLEKDDPR